MVLNVSAAASTTIPVCAYSNGSPCVASRRKKLPGVIRER
jgi:hypothetical protein